MKTEIKVTILLLFALTCCIVGCPKQVDIVYPISLQDRTLGLEPKWSDKKVILLKILTCDKAPQHNGKQVLPNWFGPCKEARDFGNIPGFQSVWYIRATAEVLAKDFRFIPGTVPSGFEQVLPHKSKRFNPTKGKDYFILVCLDPINDSVYSFGKKWIQ